MAGSKLEDVRYWRRKPKFTKEELTWMSDNWKRLKEFSEGYDAVEEADKSHEEDMEGWLSEKMISQQGQHDEYRHMTLQEIKKIPSRALELPEIVFKVVQYLDAKDIVTSSHVSKGCYHSFAPFAWQNIHFGAVSDDNDSGKSARKVSVKDITGDFIGFEYNINIVERQQQLQHPLAHLFNCSKWVVSLSIHKHDNLLPLMFGLECQGLKSITMEALKPNDGSHTTKHWWYCKEIFQKNKATLQSVTLVNWSFTKKQTPGQPTWCPIERCIEALGLRYLSLQNCTIKGRHWKPFWKLCDILEELRMDRVEIELSKSPLGNGEIWPTYPRMKDLHLTQLITVPEARQLDNLIKLFPNLRVLFWDVHGYDYAVRSRFCNLYAASTWPDLDWIASNRTRYLYDDDLNKLLVSARKPFRRIDFHTVEIKTRTLEEYQSHFEVIRKIVLVRYRPNLRPQMVRILESCPLLEFFKVDDLRAKDIIDSKPWVCIRLKTLITFINMGFENNGNRRRLTPEELEQCRMVYSRLQVFQDLENLDMFDTFETARRTSSLETANIVTIPLRLKAGLDQLAKWTKLKRLSFWNGVQVMPKRELDWIVEHWKQLNYIAGVWSRDVSNGNQDGDKYLRSANIRAWLKARGIDTSNCMYHSSYEMNNSGGFEDWCESSEE
ncbi:hypothetical protein BGZ76_004729 [Entomortierella beljakovae]|nr:hypothetical protein BGZ76_004729 [Entomortierella beljakovae]